MSPVRVSARAALLVLAVLVGLVGMHALAPGDAVAAERGPGAHAMSGHAAGGHVSTGHDDAAAVLAAACSHDEPAGHGGQHADGTCASAGVAGAPVLAPPLGVAEPAADGAAVLAVRNGPGSAAERAPPSLAELQLLRI
ncbi:DUF6153 family protein [Streptomyces coryli]|uniref:DUF6153 family protein n=1 Tax=Streptomyces coryli TaxID=1128680 RepID=UPI0030B8F35C